MVRGVWAQPGDEGAQGGAGPGGVQLRVVVDEQVAGRDRLVEVPLVQVQSCEVREADRARPAFLRRPAADRLRQDPDPAGEVAEQGAHRRLVVGLPGGAAFARRAARSGRLRAGERVERRGAVAVRRGGDRELRVQLGALRRGQFVLARPGERGLRDPPGLLVVPERVRLRGQRRERRRVPGRVPVHHGEPERGQVVALGEGVPVVVEAHRPAQPGELDGDGQQP